MESETDLTCVDCNGHKRQAVKALPLSQSLYTTVHNLQHSIMASLQTSAQSSMLYHSFSPEQFMVFNALLQHLYRAGDSFQHSITASIYRTMYNQQLSIMASLQSSTQSPTHCSLFSTTGSNGYS